MRGQLEEQLRGSMGQSAAESVQSMVLSAWATAAQMRSRELFDIHNRCALNTPPWSSASISTTRGIVRRDELMVT